MPTGSRDAEVLLDWLLQSMGLIRRASSSEDGALHKIMREALLVDPLRGWDSNELGHQTGLSNTGIHHQMTKLRECGLVSAQVVGKWHRYVLRGGSITGAVMIVQSQANTILSLRLSELAAIVAPSDTRMNTEAEETEEPLIIRVSEHGPIDSDHDSLGSLVQDLGLAGESKRSDDGLALKILSELCSAHHPITLLGLSERVSESRGRVGTVIERMRSAGLVERAPMVERIPQDVFGGLVRQLDARGEEWLMTRGGLGRLEESVSHVLLTGAKQGDLDIDRVENALSSVRIEDQRVLLNTLGGRMPYGFRIGGHNGDVVSNKISHRVERVLRRILTVAQRLQDSLS